MPTVSPRDEPDRDAHARRRLPLVTLTLRLAAASAVIAALSLLAGPMVRAPRSPLVAEAPVPLAAPAAAPTRAPIAAVRPTTPALGTARLRLSEPGIDPVMVEPGRIDPVTGSREDGLSRGAFAVVDAPVLRLVLTRGAGADRAPGLFVLLARRAAGTAGLAVLRTGLYGRVATKFGAVETVEATLSGAVERTCTAFVTREAAVRLDGWLCAPLGRAPEPRALACTLDALALDDPADPAASGAFRTAGPRDVTGCDRPTAATDPAARTGSIGRRTARTGK